jgi:DNA end-binding protein Ku
VPDGEERAVRARAIWSGTISFGLVSIPVNLFPANRPRRVSLRMLDEDGAPLSRRYYDPETGKEVPGDRIVRGYEIEAGEFVVVTDEELEALEPEKSRDIDLRRFVDRSQIDPLFFDRAYFLTPGGNSTKAYRLLAAVMERSGRAGIATFVMRTREYLVAILAEGGILRAETLRFHDEIRPLDDIDLPDRPRVPRARVKTMESAIRAASAQDLDASELEDRFADRLLSLVERKREKGADVVTAPTGIADEESVADVIDLMEVLKRSLRAGDGEAGDPRRRAGGRDPGSSRGSRRGPDLRELTKAELYERARELDIAGRSGMTKDELVRAIRRSA